MANRAKILRRMVWATIGTLGVAVALAIGLGVWSYCHPHKAWNFVSRHFLPADLTITFQEVNLHLHPLSWKEWTVNATVEDLMINKATPRLELPIDNLRLVATVKLFSPSWSIAVGDLSVVARDTILYRAANEATSPTDYRKLVKRAMNYVNVARERIITEHIAIDLDNIRYVSGDADITVNTHLHQDGKSVALSSSILNLSEAVKQLRLQGNADLDHLGQPQPFGHFVATASGEKIWLHSAIDVGYHAKRFFIDADSQILFGRGEKRVGLYPFLHADVDAQALNLRLKGTLLGIPTPLIKLGDLQGEFRMPIADLDSPTTFQIRMPIDFFFLDRNMRSPIEAACHCRIPEEVLADFHGRAWPQAWLEETTASRDILDGHFVINSFANRLFDVALAANLKIRRENDRWHFEPVMDSQVTLHSFQGLRRILDARNIPIPAPFDVLDGKMVLQAKAPIRFPDDFTPGNWHSLSTEGELAVDLASAKQKVQIKTHAALAFKHGFTHADLNVNSLIEHLELQLPPFKPIAGFPKLVPDPRIQLHPIEKAKPGAFTVGVNLSAKTAGPGAVKLYSGLTQPYIPLEFQLAQHGKIGPDGTIRVDPFKIVYLRRTLSVDSFQLKLNDNPDQDYPINGNFHVDQTDYKVKIHIAGTTNNPQIELSSVPYLSYNDIISVLLYDRTASELDSGDAETAGNVQAAMADRAIGLLGIWLFAATPIRSFTYNPMTKMYSATVALGNGVTAGVGTDWEQSTMLQVRKRLSRRWIVMVSWSPSAEDPDQKISKLTLQWERRF